MSRSTAGNQATAERSDGGNRRGRRAAALAPKAVQEAAQQEAAQQEAVQQEPASLVTGPGAEAAVMTADPGSVPAPAATAEALAGSDVVSATEGATSAEAASDEAASEKQGPVSEVMPAAQGATGVDASTPASAAAEEAEAAAAAETVDSSMTEKAAEQEADEDDGPPSPVNYDEEGLGEVEIDGDVYRFDSGKQGTALCLSARREGVWRWRYLGELRWDGRDLRSKVLERSLLTQLSASLRSLAEQAN